MEEVKIGDIVSGYCDYYRKNVTAWIYEINDQTFLNSSFNGKEFRGYILRESDLIVDSRFGTVARVILNKYRKVEIIKTGVSREGIKPKHKKKVSCSYGLSSI